MKVLFIASNHYDQPTLLLEREITEIQRRLDQAVMHQLIKVKFLPDVPIEQIPSEISKFKPDILHISCHGKSEALWFRTESGKTIEVKAAVLSALLDTDHPPELVYLNACDSSPVAAAITKTVRFAMGTTAPITNSAARTSVCRFYELIFQGYPLQKAFENSKALLDAIGQGQVSSELHPVDSADAGKKTFIEPFRLVAELKRFSRSKGDYSINLGVTGCPYDASMIVFVTDDDTWGDPAISHASGPPVSGKAWAEHTIEIWGDLRIAVIATTGDGRAYTTTGTVCEALERYWKEGKISPKMRALEAEFREAVKYLADHATAFTPEED